MIEDREMEIDLLRRLVDELEASGRGDSSAWWGTMARLVELESGSVSSGDEGRPQHEAAPDLEEGDGGEGGRGRYAGAP